jgi:formylmethanofuran dehydrogenase subunit B
MITIDIRETPVGEGGGHRADHQAGQGFELGTTMRALMKGQRVDEARVAEIGLSLDTIKDVVERMKRAEVRRHLLRHGSLDDARQAHELRPAS